ncbi:MspA family porin [Mycobacterium sp. URHB0021]
MVVRPLVVFAACFVACAPATPIASAEPDTAPVVAEVPAPQAAPPPPPDDGRVESSPPATTTTPDGWTLTLSARDETQRTTAPLTTAISSREYEVGGIFSGSLTGPESADPPEGTLEVGYQIGCGIDMSTSNGVSLTGTMGLSPSIGVLGTDLVSPIPEGVIPGVGTNIGGGVTVGLKPGLINIVPVSKKAFHGADPWIMVDGFRIKIDGCVGESFIRSYAFLTRSTPMSDAVRAWYGVTKKV